MALLHFHFLNKIYNLIQEQVRNYKDALSATLSGSFLHMIAGNSTQNDPTICKLIRALSNGAAGYKKFFLSISP